MTPLTPLHRKWKGMERGTERKKEKEGRHGGMGE